MPRRFVIRDKDGLLHLSCRTVYKDTLTLAKPPHTEQFYTWSLHCGPNAECISTGNIDPHAVTCLACKVKEDHYG
jgi:hypothetical protein